MDDVTIQEWQDRVNKIGKQYSRSTVRNVDGLIKNLYGYAVPRELCRKAFGRFFLREEYFPVPARYEKHTARTGTSRENAALLPPHLQPALRELRRPGSGPETNDGA